MAEVPLRFGCRPSSPSAILANAPRWWWKARRSTPVTETITIVVIGIFFGIVGIGLLRWLFFSLAVHALPFFAAVSAGLWDYHGDAGPVGAVFAGILAGVVTLVAGQYVLAFARSTWIRVAVALLFAAPAAVAGYHATLGLAKLTMPSGAWQIAFSIIGAAAVGVTAWTRMALPPDHLTHGIARGWTQPGPSAGPMLGKGRQGRPVVSDASR